MMYIKILPVVNSGPSGLTSPSSMCNSYRFIATKREGSGRVGVGEGGSRQGCGISSAYPLKMAQSWDARVAFSFSSLFSTLSLLLSFIHVCLVKDEKDDNNSAIVNNYAVNRYSPMFCHAVWYVFFVLYCTILCCSCLEKNKKNNKKKSSISIMAMAMIPVPSPDIFLMGTSRICIPWVHCRDSVNHQYTNIPWIQHGLI